MDNSSADITSAAKAHAQPASEVLQALASTEQGLAETEAAARLTRFGRNELPPPKPRSALRRFFEQFNNALILCLLAAAGLAAVLGHWVDALVIVAVVLVNAIVGFVQEGKAEGALAALQAMLAPSARVLRDGERRRIDVAELVPGDVVLLEAGDRVPADLRLLQARGLLVDEAILTGESVTAEKNESEVAVNAALGDRTSMAWSGTLVAAGQGSGVVVATGQHTEIGKINRLLGQAESLTTPLLRQINAFARAFSLLAVVLALLLFALAILIHQYPWSEALMMVVAVAVSLIPEGLPAVITITLAMGVRKMAARHAIVRRLPAVETLGSTSVICSDKTGTLTRNEMTVRHLMSAAGVLEVSGSGYAPEGGFTAENADVAFDEGFLQLLETAALCNDAELKNIAGDWRVDGDPMEGALLAVAMKGGLAPAALAASFPRRDVIPFDARHRWMASLHPQASGALLHVKGAPEEVLALASSQRGADGNSEPLEPGYWETLIAKAAARGERVLAFARKRISTPPARLVMEDVSGLEFLGLAGFIDPPRDEAITAVADCQSAGITVKMITGDHAATAAAIARQLGIAETPQVRVGQSLDDVSDADLAEVAAKTDVFARASPEHKLRIVRALQSRGQVVAMTGDGVNDAPSLKQADVGIAMGQKGTEAAREASEVVLSDDNFASIAAAVHEGRTVYDNIRKVVTWTLPTNGGETLAIMIALLAGLTLPMSAVQILWINMILTITLGLVLAFEPAEPGVMKRPPRPSGAALISPFMWWRIVLVSLLFTFGAFGVFQWALSRGLGVEAARTLVVNTICAMEIFYLFSVRYLHMTSLTRIGVRGTGPVLLAVLVVVLAQLAFTFLPVMQQLFDTRPLGVTELAVATAIGIALMLVLEMEKAALRRLGWFEELRRTEC